MTYVQSPEHLSCTVLQTNNLIFPPSIWTIIIQDLVTDKWTCKIYHVQDSISQADVAETERKRGFQPFKMNRYQGYATSERNTLLCLLFVLVTANSES